MRSFHLVSLGCAKNLVDSELVLGDMTRNGFSFEEDPEKADVLMVNTCGFIQPAVEEAIEEILGLAQIKENHPGQKIVAFGCFVQRYQQDLIDELPEVDLFVGTEGCHDMAARVQQLFETGDEEKIQLPERFLMDSSMPRILSTPNFRAWLKVTEGCDNRCSYCMIPSIRGRLRSRRIADLVTESKRLEETGVKEISLIAQDLTAYGDDLDSATHLVALLENILEETTIPWIRLLYLYPPGVDDKLLQLIANNSRIVPYLDIPFQHVSSSVLKRMNRRYSYEDLCKVIENIREYIPDISLRTTFLLGFPGETEEDVDLLVDFMEKYRFDHVGVFPYANESGSPSENYPDQVPEEVAQARVDRVMAVQSEISEVIQQQYIGSELQVLVEGLSKETDLLLEGRTRYQAPDVDGCVYINDGTANPGDIVTVKIEDAQIYDLVGGIVNRDSLKEGAK